MNAQLNALSAYFQRLIPLRNYDFVHELTCCLHAVLDGVGGGLQAGERLRVLPEAPSEGSALAWIKSLNEQFA